MAGYEESILHVDATEEAWRVAVQFLDEHRDSCPKDMFIYEWTMMQLLLGSQSTPELSRLHSDFNMQLVYFRELQQTDPNPLTYASTAIVKLLRHGGSDKPKDPKLYPVGETGFYLVHDMVVTNFYSTIDSTTERVEITPSSPTQPGRAVGHDADQRQEPL